MADIPHGPSSPCLHLCAGRAVRVGHRRLQAAPGAIRKMGQQPVLYDPLCRMPVGAGALPCRSRSAARKEPAQAPESLSGRPGRDRSRFQGMERRFTPALLLLVRPKVLCLMMLPTLRIFCVGTELNTDAKCLNDLRHLAPSQFPRDMVFETGISCEARTAPPWNGGGARCTCHGFPRHHFDRPVQNCSQDA